MQRIILTLIFSFVFTFIYSKPCKASVDLISPIKNTVVETNDVVFQWNNTDDSSAYCYSVAVGTQEDPDGMWYPDMSSKLVSSSSYTFTLPASYEGKVHWYIQYGKEKDGICTPTLYSTSETFMLNLNEKASATVSILQVQPTPKVKTSIIAKPVSETIAWNVNTMDAPAVLGVNDQSYDCEYKYIEGQKNAQLVHCNPLLFKVSRVERSENKTNIQLYVYGSYNRNIDLLVNVYRCERELFNPKTWFQCSEKFVSSKLVSVPINIFLHIKGANNTYDIAYFENDGDSYKLMSYIDKNDADLYLEYKYKIDVTQYGILRDGGGSIQLVFTDTKEDYYKTFTFPLSEITGVTQWHGNTVYQKPHTGIDFGAVKQNVVAVSKGEVIGIGWDNYNGDCFSGGNYIVIRQSNGMYTVYFHLDTIYVDAGQNVKAKQVIAISGNTGSWNCQPLAYHLHFETRLKRSQSSHVDPVKYIDVDWSQIFTTGANYFPGRLSGDNPHPGI